MRKHLLSAVAVCALALAGVPALADMAAAERWIDEEFQPSVLSRDEQLAEMQWFIKAAEPFKGMEINVLSETIPTHEYESKTLAKAFEEITGIKVNHQLLGEGEVVQAVQTQMQTQRNLYDGYINDSDLIGTHSRLQSAVNLTDWMAGEGKDVTNPGLDIDDFMGISFTTGPDGKLWQLPDQQFANLYWFRKDWFDEPDIKAEVQGEVRLRAGRAGQLVGLRGHRRVLHQRCEGDRRRPDLRPHGLRQARARPWLAHDGCLAVDGRRGRQGPAERPPRRRVGHPHGGGLVQPRRRQRQPRRRRQRPGRRLRHRQVGRVAAASTRLRARPSYDFYQSLPALSQGNVAQQIFWYTAFTANMVAPKSEGNNTVDDEGKPLWRMAPSPHGPYWEEGQKLGYQDAGSWTLFNSTPVDRRKAAWLYAQFVTSKTVDVKKSQVGLTFIRDSTVRDKSFTERAPKLGGLIEFYRSPDRVLWTPTGINVPDYPKLAQIWWQQIGDVNSGAFTPQEAMDRLAARDGRDHGPDAGGRRAGERLPWLRSAAERGEGPAVLARPAGRARSQAREREAQGRDHRL